MKKTFYYLADIHNVSDFLIFLFDCPSVSHSLQVLRYFDYVFTGVFTFEMIIKVSYGVNENDVCVVNIVACFQWKWIFVYLLFPCKFIFKCWKL